MHILEDRRSEKITSRVVANRHFSAIQYHLRALFQSRLYPLNNPFPAHLGSQRAKLGLLIKPVAKLHPRSRLLKLDFYLIIDLADYDHVIRAQAALSRHAETSPEQVPDRLVYFRIWHDNDMVLAIAV